MDNKKILVLLLMAFLLVGTLAPMVSAFMPRFTHKLIHQQSTINPIDSEIFRACEKFPSLCYTGNVLTDISVIWYWTEGEKYAVTHSPNFCRALIEESQNDQEYACAVGGCMHQPADIPSHNKMVPYAIEHSFLANYIIHVFAEQKVDNWVEDNYPGIGDEALNYMADYETCTPLFKRVMLGNEQYGDITEEEVDEKFDKFIVEIQTSQTGYDTAFKQKSFLVNFNAIPFTVLAGFVLIMLFWLLLVVLLVIKMIKKEATLKHYIAIFVFLPLFLMMLFVFIGNLQGAGFNTIIKIAKPVSFLVPLGNSPEFYVNEAVDNSIAFLNQGPQWLTDTDASGFDSLAESDRKILIVDYIILFVLTGLLILYIWFLFKKNKIKPTKTFSSDFNL